MKLLLFLGGLVAWGVPTAAGIWYLVTFREVRDELKTIRRYLQAIYERQDQR